jgi:hypothetical protein
VALVVEPAPQALLALPTASRLHQLAYVVLRSIAVYTYQIACQHIRAYRIDEKAYSLVGGRPPRDFATTITTRSFESANLRISSEHSKTDLTIR